MEHQPSKRNPIVKVLLIGCGVMAILALALVVWFGIWLFTGPEGGVRLANEMEQYASDYLAEHEILEPGEELLAYYDVTMSLNGTEAAIVTSDRVIYHNAGNNTSIAIRDIEDINHRYETLIGDVIEVHSSSGRAIKIEIAPLNQGETFKNILMTVWEKAESEAEDG